MLTLGGGDAHPSVKACSWYMKLWSKALVGAFDSDN